MPTTNPLEELPVLAFFIIFGVVSFVAYEIGFQIGHWYQARTPDIKEGPTGVLVGSILALLAFLLAITMGMASDRFDTRRGLVLEEANTIQTTYLRAGYLPEPASSEIRNLLRAYVPLRVAPPDLATLQENAQRSEELLLQIWSVAEAEAKVTKQGDLMAAFIESLNETIDLHESRVAAGVYSRVPATILWLLCRWVGPDAGDGRLQRRVDQAARPVECDRPDHRARCRPRTRDRPRPATGRVRPGQPAADHRPPAADRPSFVIDGRIGDP